MNYGLRLLPNAIVKFHANYLEDDGQPTKKRSHLVIEVDEIRRTATLLKITSKWKNYFWQAKLGAVKCLSKTSFIILNRIIIFDLSTLQNDQDKFRICQVHQGGCVEERRFRKIVRKLRKFWKNPLNRDKLKTKLNWSKLKVMEK
jgi:hypothetical protein